MGIRSYNAFLKAAKARGALSHKQAQQTYRVMSARLSRSLKGVDVQRHPRIFKLSSESARRGAGRKGVPKLGGVERVPAPTAPREKRVRRMEDWDDSGDFDYGEYESSADYGEEE